MKIVMEVFGQYRGLSRSAHVIFFGRMVTSMGAFIWPLLTLIMSRKIGYSATTIAWIFVVIGALFIPANLFGGKLADRFDRKKIIVLFDSASVVLFIACGFIEPGNLMTVLFVGAGLFANMEGPAYEALIADATKPHEREKVYSLSYLGYNLGFIMGAAVGGMLFENHLNLAFILDGLTTLVSCLMIAWFVVPLKEGDLASHERNAYEDHAPDRTSTWEVLRGIRPVLVQFGVFMLASFIYEQWTFILPLYMDRVFGSDGARLYGLVAGFNGLVVILLTPVLTRVLAGFSEIPKMMLGIVMYASSFLIIRNGGWYPLFVGMMFVFTTGEVINMLGLGPYISRRVPASHRGRVNSWRFICYFIGGTAGRVLTGWLAERWSFEAAFTAIVCAGFLAAAVMAFNYKTDRRRFPKLYGKEPVLAGRTGAVS